MIEDTGQERGKGIRISYFGVLALCVRGRPDSLDQVLRHSVLYMLSFQIKISRWLQEFFTITQHKIPCYL